MARLGSWIEVFPEGIYVRPADAWIDPSQPKPRALITHGHGDHARGGHGAVLATPETLAIMGLRYGDQNGQPVAYGESVRVGDVELSFVPAGHVLGSAQIVLEHKGEKIVVSGDYKRREDPTCHEFVPVPCDVFITEATFGLPVFHHPDTGGEIDRLLHRLHSDESRCVLVGAYALGKAQVLTKLFGHWDPVFVHDSVAKMNSVHSELGIELKNATMFSEAEEKGLLSKHRPWIMIAPLMSGRSTFLKRVKEQYGAVTVGFSGWAADPRYRYTMGVDYAMPFSDHCDYRELVEAVKQCDPDRV